MEIRKLIVKQFAEEKNFPVSRPSIKYTNLNCCKSVKEILLPKNIVEQFFELSKKNHHKIALRISKIFYD